MKRIAELNEPVFPKFAAKYNIEIRKSACVLQENIEFINKIFRLHIRFPVPRPESELRIKFIESNFPCLFPLVPIQVIHIHILTLFFSCNELDALLYPTIDVLMQVSVNKQSKVTVQQ